ncbi:MAG: hypothetical protein JOZ73_02465 [Solirubrobacterales bacterium]|nr:hypothetical protein [Solirubrobacterales bacterium]
MNIYRWDGSEFVQVPGSLDQIAIGSFEGRAVWGINANSDIFKFDPDSGSFKQVEGKLTTISVGDVDAIWGINANSDIFRFDPASGSFKQVQGKLTSISVSDASSIWGINANSDIFRFDPVSGSFKQVQGKLTSISAGATDGGTWGINANSDIFRFDPASGFFEQVQGKLTSIYGGDSPSAWGLDDAQDIFVFQGQSFVQVPGKLVLMAVWNGFQWGINASLHVFERGVTETEGAFLQVPGQLRKIAVDQEGFAWGLN